MYLHGRMILSEKPATFRDHAQRTGVAIVAAACLLLAGAAGAAEQKRAGIRVIEATYGGNCAGVRKGNVTQFVAAACNDKTLCNYRIYYKEMGGDPAEGCAKAFSLSYACAKSGKRERCNVAAEAGSGGEDGKPNEFCMMACTVAPPPLPKREGLVPATPTMPFPR
jgi:hypothetical protein